MCQVYIWPLFTQKYQEIIYLRKIICLVLFCSIEQWAWRTHTFTNVSVSFGKVKAETCMYTSGDKRQEHWTEIGYTDPTVTIPFVAFEVGCTCVHVLHAVDFTR